MLSRVQNIDFFLLSRNIIDTVILSKLKTSRVVLLFCQIDFMRAKLISCKDLTSTATFSLAKNVLRCPVSIFVSKLLWKDPSSSNET